MTRVPTSLVLLDRSESHMADKSFSTRPVYFWLARARALVTTSMIDSKTERLIPILDVRKIFPVSLLSGGGG